MKTKISIFAIIFLSLIFVNIAKAQDLKSKLNDIKFWYKEIKDNEKKFTKKIISVPTDVGEEGYTIYKSGNEVKIIVQGKNGGGDCAESNSIYYRNGVPFFVLYESECFVDNKTTKDVSRFYIDNGKLIQYLEGNAKKNIKPGSDEFNNEEKMILRIIDEAKQYLK